MPIFGKKQKSPELPINGGAINENLNKNSNINNDCNNVLKNDNSPKTRTQAPKLIFQCQLAEGSHTGHVSGFSNMKELYEKIAECFNIPASDVSIIRYIVIKKR
jgi:hypothetical protein